MKDFRLSRHIRYLLYTYLIAIGFFSLFRLVILPLNAGEFSSILEQDKGFSLIIKAFIMGFRFDTVIACYLLAIPILKMATLYFLNIKKELTYRIVHYFTILLFIIAFLISMIDIPYFNFFFNRFTVQAFAWMDSPVFVFKMIFQDITYALLLLVGAVVIYLYIFFMNKMYRKTFAPIFNTDNKPSLKLKLIHIPVFILVLGFCFLGMRGRIEKKSPIRTGTAYFSNNPLINQMGLNPTFTLIKSIEERSKQSAQKLDLMDQSAARKLVETAFSEMKSNTIGERETILGPNTNVVIVLMESMGTCFVEYFGADYITPNLDYLANNSVSYENVYTAGIHTYNGVFSTLFGQPALMERHSMKYTMIPKIEGGLPAVLKSEGYNTYYFTTHDAQFDNTGGFLAENDVENIIAVEDFPSHQVQSALGVPDHVLFEKVVDVLSERKSDKPFFAVMLTASNHDPLIIPKDIPFKPKDGPLKDQVIEYSDWAIGKFLEDAKKTDWFENTLFVFVADHGAYVGRSKYDIPLTYHHTPYYFYHPKLSAEINNSIGLQIDTPAMIYSYLGIENEETLGVPFDLQPRKYAYFSADDKMGVMDNEYLYIWHRNGNESLHKLKDENVENYIDQEPEKAKEMREYGFAMMMESDRKINQ